MRHIKPEIGNKQIELESYECPDRGRTTFVLECFNERDLVEAVVDEVRMEQRSQFVAANNHVRFHAGEVQTPQLDDRRLRHGVPVATHAILPSITHAAPT